MGEDIYGQMLPRDASEVERLNFQHQLLVKTIGYLLHPDIERCIGPDSRIAEIATGTGIFLTDLARSVPVTCGMDGFDLSADQFPSSKNLPENLNFHVADAKAPVDSRFRNKFDVVNIRYLQAGMKPEDWETVTQNMYDMLKPGGWLQWLEPDLVQAVHWTRQDLRAHTSAQEAAERLVPWIQHFEYPCKELTGIFSRAGFQRVVHDKISSDRLPETRPAWAEVNLGPMYQLLLMLERKKGSGSYSSEQCTNLMEKIRKEADAGIIYTRFDLHVFVGQKP